ncbi:hypothetical protein Cgig2_021612 [Carnegiea gigantea]|uniref:F-box protein n=1 Tax=Carnegiea gigantea TaxID=171969 RepID=A0A9Q1JMB9_9CARY|nr:hypothetical protein Cgig2_021612 [Carnegiea gigantea]
MALSLHRYLGFGRNGDLNSILKRSYHGESHALWNPAVSELKVLPPIMTKPNLSSNRTFADNEVYGFGYDIVTQDYKVVVLKGAIQGIQVLVYDSGDDVDSYYKHNLAIYDDSLAFLVVHEPEKCLDIWTWNGGLWTKKFAIGTTITIRRRVGHWKKNKLILESPECGIFLCDPNTQEIWDLAFQLGCWCYGVFVYRESLVSIEDRNKWGHHEEAETDANHF